MRRGMGALRLPHSRSPSRCSLMKLCCSGCECILTIASMLCASRESPYSPPLPLALLTRLTEVRDVLGRAWAMSKRAASGWAGRLNALLTRLTIPPLLRSHAVLQRDDRVDSVGCRTSVAGRCVAIGPDRAGRAERTVGHWQLGRVPVGPCRNGQGCAGSGLGHARSKSAFSGRASRLDTVIR
jgi:hypothetical protein